MPLATNATVELAAAIVSDAQRGERASAALAQVISRYRFGPGQAEQLSSLVSSGAPAAQVGHAAAEAEAAVRVAVGDPS